MSTSTVHKQAADTNAAESSPQSSSSVPIIQATAPAENNGISSSSNGTNPDNSCNTSNSNAADSSSSNGGSSNNGSVSSSTNNSCASVSASNNPFARAVAQPQSWNTTEATDHPRPVLAPSKLGGFGCSNSSTVLAPSKLGSSSSILAPSKLFGGAGGSTTIPKILQPAAAHQAEVKFKLKPSILGSAVTTNPFGKVPGPVSDMDGGDDSNSYDKMKQTAKDDSSTDSKPLSSATKDSSNDRADSSSEAKSTAQSSSSSQNTSSITPPPSPPHSTTTTNQSPPDSSKCTSSISGDLNVTSSSNNSSIPSLTEAASSSSSRSVFGVFGKAAAAVAVQDKRPVAASSPNPPPTLSSNGVKSPLPSAGSAAATSFIFGQNLRTRIAGAAEESSPAEVEAAATAGPALAASDNFFSAAASTLATNSTSGSSQTFNGGPAKSLETSSRELAEKESREKRKFEEVEVITGEETESNVLQMNCKVYSWVRGSWQERGRGLLRLNDWGTGGVEMHSRLVVRTQGTLTIMLNTNIWSEMSVERASSKSVRFTASDPDGQPKIYLVMGQPKDIELLYTSLEYRVSNSRHREERESKRARTED